MKKVLIVVLGVMVVGLLGFVFTNNSKVDNKLNKDIKVNKNINSNELFSKEYESAQVKLDNMSLEEMQEAVRIIEGRAETECSGNVTKENIARLSAIGVNYISSGALTHSAPILDISLKNLHAI